MSQTVCYVDRLAGGAALKGLRLVTRRGTHSWTAGGAPRSSRAAIEAAQAGARWLAEQTGMSTGSSGSGGALPTKDIVLCADLDAACCSWMSAPSPEVRVVKAAAQAVLAGAGAQDQVGASGPSSTWLSAGALGMDESVQGLSESPSEPGRYKRARSTAAGAHRQRMGVLAVPDLALRTLLDALDDLGRAPLRVISLWHAMAEAWGQSTADATHGERPSAVAESVPATAVVLADPDGRLCWCWSRSGRLLAAGSLRLRRVVAEGAVDEPDALATPESNGAGVGREVSVLEVTRADVGRVSADWLAWGMELGVAPSRVVCLGPARLTTAGLESDLPDTSGVAALGEALARSWPGAAVVAHVDDDPVGATLRRLIDVNDDRPSGMGELEELSARPGRLTRTWHRWMAGAMFCAALVIGALGLRFSRAAAHTQTEIDDLRTRRTQLLEQVKGLAPAAPTHADPVAIIRAERDKIDKAMKQVQPERPVLEEMSRMLRATGAVPGLQVTKMFFNSQISCQAVFDAPDSKAWQQFQDALNAEAHGPVYVEWSFTVRPDNSRPGKSVYQAQGPWKDAGARPAPIGGGNP